MGHRASPGRPVKTESLGTRLAMLSGRTECVPPRKPPFTPSQGLPSKPLYHRLAVWRRGGLRTPGNEASPPPGDRPIGPPGGRLPPLIMSCLGLGTAWPYGRGDRAPPRRLPRRHLRPFPARPSPLGSPVPRRGGLRTPGRKARASSGHLPIGARAARLAISANEMPRQGDGLSMRAHRVRPSEKTPLAASRAFPRTAIHAGLVPPGGAGSARP